MLEINIPEKIKLIAVSVGSKYSKRWLESLYDSLMKTGFGKTLKDLPQWQKLTAELGLYTSSALAESHISESDGLVSRFLREIFEDIAPEIAKRMINGNHSQVKSLTNHTPESTQEEVTNSQVTEFSRWLKNATESDIRTLKTMIRDDIKESAVESFFTGFASGTTSILKDMTAKMRARSAELDRKMASRSRRDWFSIRRQP